MDKIITWSVLVFAIFFAGCSGDGENSGESNSYSYGDGDEFGEYVEQAREAALSCRYQNSWFSYEFGGNPDNIWDIDSYSFNASYHDYAYEYDYLYWLEEGYSPVTEKECIFSGLELFSSVIELLDGIFTIGNIFFKTQKGGAEFTPLQGVSFADIFDDLSWSVFEIIYQIRDQAAWQLANGCDCFVPNGLLIDIPVLTNYGETRSYRMYGLWGRPEKTVMLSLANLIVALFEFIYAHNYDFDMSLAIPIFEKLFDDDPESNLPARLNALSFLINDNLSFLTLPYSSRLPTSRNALKASLGAALALLNESLWRQTDENSFLFHYDQNGNGLPDGGDMLVLNMGIANYEYERIDPEIPYYIMPECGNDGLPKDETESFCVSAGFAGELSALLENKVIPALERVTPVNCLAEGETGCIRLSEIGSVLAQLGLIADPLPDVLLLDPSTYFTVPKSLRSILFDGTIVGRGVIAEGELADSSCYDYEGIHAGCGDYVSLGDSAHLNDTLRADGVVPPTAFQMSLFDDSTSLPGGDYQSFVLPYLLIGDATFNGSVYYDLSGFSAGRYEPFSGVAQSYPSRFSEVIDGLDFSVDGAGQPEVAGCGNARCQYEAAKLLAIYFLESGVLDP